MDAKRIRGIRRGSLELDLIVFGGLALMARYAWGVPDAKEPTMLKTDETTRANRRLTPGTTVISTEDGEPGRIVQVCTYRRNGVDAWSYLVETQYGREVWEAGSLFVPDQ